MKSVLRRIASLFGYEISRKRPQHEIQHNSSIESFHSDHYLRHNARRLEHLASLRISVAGKRVLEVGAGVGDHTSYYLDRGCDVTITEARVENIAILRLRYPQQKIFLMDLERPEVIEGAPFEVVHCYGLLYHLMNPERALEFMSNNCTEILFLETCVSFGYENEMNLTEEPRDDPTQSFSGTGCRPTRSWVFAQLKKRFPYVYCPLTQPNHGEFPLDWNAPEEHAKKNGLQRSVFVAARHEIASEVFTARPPDIQQRHE